MANNWENSNQVLQAICPTNALKLDDMNQPSAPQSASVSA